MLVHVAALLFLGVATGADLEMSGPAEVKTTAEVVAAAEKDDLQGGLRRTPHVSTVEFHGGGQKTFVAWYNPYSGRADCHVYIYRYDAQKNVWVRKLANVFRGTSRVSVEFGDDLTLRNTEGSVIYRDAAE